MAIDAPAAISVPWLLARGACLGQVLRFAATFGWRARLTRANLLRAAGRGLSISWLAVTLLDDAGFAALMYGARPALAAYHAARRASQGLPDCARRVRDAGRAYAAAIARALGDALGLP